MLSLVFVSEVLLEAVFLSVDPYMRWVGSCVWERPFRMNFGIQYVVLFFFSLSPGRSVEFAWKKATWWSELKWPSKEHKQPSTHTGMFFYPLFVMMNRTCLTFTETELVLHLLLITEVFDSQKAKTDSRNVLGWKFRRSHQFHWW